MGGVDIAREERIKKAEVCVELMWTLFKSNGLMKALNRKGEVGEVAM